MQVHEIQRSPPLPNPTQSLPYFLMDTLVLEVLIRIMCDVRPVRQVNGAYIYCQTRENQGAVFHTGYSLIQDSFASKILILNSVARNGYPGFSSWREGLMSEGISDNDIVGVEITEGKPLNTLIESEALIRFAKKQGLSSLIVVASPFQHFRAYMTAVTAAIREFPELVLYSKPAVALSWKEEVYHSQGTLKAKRKKLIQHELERIVTYQRKGDLAMFEDVLSYLNDREDQ